MKDVNQDRLNNTLSKQYQFDTKGLLRRAAGLTKANFSSLLQGSVVLFLTFVVLGVFAQQYITINDDGTYVFEHQSIIEIVAICIVAPLLTGLYMMGVFCCPWHENFSIYRIPVFPSDIFAGANPASKQYSCSARFGAAYYTWRVLLFSVVFFTYVSCRQKANAN